jgi:hypothetical protein
MTTKGRLTLSFLLIKLGSINRLKFNHKKSNERGNCSNLCSHQKAIILWIVSYNTAMNKLQA